MGNDLKRKSKKEILDYIRSDDFPKKKIENIFLQRNVKLSDLTKEELEILKCLPKTKNAYYCNNCPSFPLIIFKSTPRKTIIIFIRTQLEKKKRR